MMRHSWRAAPRGGTTASVTCMNGVLKKPISATGTSSRSRNVVAGQDVVGVPAGLGDVEVERHHQIELAERRFERVAVGHGQHRVARGHEERADLPRRPAS